MNRGRSRNKLDLPSLESHIGSEAEACDILAADLGNGVHIRTGDVDGRKRRRQGDGRRRLGGLIPDSVPDLDVNGVGTVRCSAKNDGLACAIGLPRSVSLGNRSIDTPDLHAYRVPVAAMVSVTEVDVVISSPSLIKNEDIIGAVVSKVRLK